MKTRTLSQEEVNVFTYLNELRNSGETNMFGARPYIEAEFGFSQEKSTKLLKRWMNNFHEDAEAYKSLEISES